MTDYFTPINEALDALQRTRELEEGRELPPEAATLEDRRRALDAAYWQAAREMVSAAIPADRTEALNFTTEQRRLLDYGVVDHPKLEAAARVTTGEKVEGVCLLHESLNAVLEDVLRRDAVKEYRQDLEALQRDIKLWPETHLAHIRYRDGKVGELLGDSPRCTHALRLLGEIDEKLEQYKQLDAKGALSDSERKTLATLKHFIGSRRERLSAILAPVTEKTAVVQTGLAAAAMAASEAVESSIAHLIELQDKRRRLEQQVIEQEQAAARVTRGDIERALRRELDNLASLLRLAARYVHRMECAVPVDPDVRRINTDAAADAVDHLLCFDPRLVDNPQAARFGPPELLLAPGIGDGVYDASRNRWIVPQRCTGSVIESLAHAAVLYRLEVDARESGNGLLESYRGCVSGAPSNLKLRTALIRDYITWMSEESAGTETLPRTTREWFEQHIAPPKDEPWLPPLYRAMSAQGLKQSRNELEQQPESADREYRLGAVAWLQGEAEAAARLFQRAVDLDSEHREAVYSAAVMQMGLHEFRHAINGFQRFTELNPTGWWARKAIEHCAHCRD